MDVLPPEMSETGFSRSDRQLLPPGTITLAILAFFRIPDSGTEPATRRLNTSRGRTRNEKRCRIIPNHNVAYRHAGNSGITPSSTIRRLSIPWEGKFSCENQATTLHNQTGHNTRKVKTTLQAGNWKSV